MDMCSIKAGEKGLDIAYLLPADLPGTIVGDVTRLRQIIVNLVNNAVKFTEKGEVVLSVERQQDTEIGDRIDDLCKLHFSVRDTGIGIPKELQNRLFQPFSQVDGSITRRYGGTGLGLAISNCLTDIMGGNMWVVSEMGQGTTFHFTIVMKVSATQVHRVTDSAESELMGKRVLIVDDNATSLHILDLQLQSWNMQVLKCTSGLEALDCIRRGETLDAAILDIQMPEMDGFTLAREISRYRGLQALPLIALNSFSGKTEARDRAYFTVFLTKPVKQRYLHKTLTDLFMHKTSRIHGQSEGVAGQVDESAFDAGLAGRFPLRILVAEDVVVNQVLLLAMLGKMGYAANVVSNGLEVISALEQQVYDVVFMDMQMPLMDGLEATRQIVQRWEDNICPRIVAVTANAMQENRDACAAAGMSDYMSKPIRVQELHAVLTRSGQWLEKRFTGIEAPVPVPIPDLKNGHAPVLAPHILANLREMQNSGMPDMIKNLLALFRADVPPLLVSMEYAIREGNAAKLKALAHNLKGASGNLGAVGLAALCAKLEKNAQAGTLTGLELVSDELEPEYQRVCSALELEGGK